MLGKGKITIFEFIKEGYMVMAGEKRIAVTGGAGQICYSLLFRIASGELFGKDIGIILQILERKEAMKALEGVVMELEDCAFDLLKGIEIGDEAKKVFDGADIAFLVGAKPRGPGMERADLLQENAKIFVEQGKALDGNDKVKVLVVGNPANTNALIASHNAPGCQKAQFRAMTRLDQNRAVSQIAAKAGVDSTEVSDVAIWGNHSATMVVDYKNAKIQGKAAPDVISDHTWFQEKMLPKVQKRGAEIIAARGSSSAASAAHAAIMAMRDWSGLNGEKALYSAAIYSRGNPYGIDEDLYFSFPMKGDKVVGGLEHDDFLRSKLEITEKELLSEREMVQEFLAKR